MISKMKMEHGKNILSLKMFINSIRFPLALFVFVFFASCESANQKNKNQDIITAEQEAALDVYFDMNIDFSDTLIKYEITEDMLILDMGNTTTDSWNITAFWMKDSISDVFSTELNQAFFRSKSNLLELDLPEGYDKELHKDLKLRLGVSPRGASYISNYQRRFSTITVFFYDESGENTLKLLGDEWNKAKYIKHRVNFMDCSDYPIEMKTFLSEKENEIIKNLK